MRTCDCEELHSRRRVVVTGGPGAGKTALLELIRHSFCRHVVLTPEAAGIVFGGGFPRDTSVPIREASQRAIFHVQRELENIAAADNPALVLCDRGTVDGGAFWPDNSVSLWSSVGTSLEKELARYYAVIHLRTPAIGSGLYNYSNPLRIETEAEAAAIDERIARLWAGHPRRYEVPATPSFLHKATRALEILRRLMPECCRHHMGSLLEGLPPEEARSEVLLGTGSVDQEC
jgi:predicted ATPase